MDQQVLRWRSTHICYGCRVVLSPGYTMSVNGDRMRAQARAARRAAVRCCMKAPLVRGRTVAINEAEVIGRAASWCYRETWRLNC